MVDLWHPIAKQMAPSSFLYVLLQLCPLYSLSGLVLEDRNIFSLF